MIQPALRHKDCSPVVLVVDDNTAIRNMVTWALVLEGYRSAEASEGQEALDWVRNAAASGYYPSVILVDLSMPGMDGSTFLGRLQEYWNTHTSFPQRPSVVVITASTNVLDAATLGVEKIIIKPFHVRDLVHTIRLLAN
jgi:CheY-like chemotaxis protein